MTFNITLKPGNRVFPAETGETVLSAGLKHGHALPYGCRGGECGGCKGRVLQGFVDHGNYYAGALSEAEKAAGIILFCCATPMSDLDIECREAGAAARDVPVKNMPCRVHKMEKLADDVMVLHLKLSANERLRFLAGQYIDILAQDDRPRSFSLGNAPHDDEFLQLHIRKIPGGAFTHHIFTQMKERDILRIRGPLGNFFCAKIRTSPFCSSLAAPVSPRSNPSSNTRCISA